ncbi:hypothetical protein [Fretibacterium sp. OH1220_COT-178]|uniref:hypothetical protein n=1 Tax=Fretibacterium sp. OH1220_COT-178 TaxID=2491047 RepID=UPI000F5F58E8|nr:hypothetical protein [Fretibacterium sp. OH1220_COT-178]
MGDASADAEAPPSGVRAPLGSAGGCCEGAGGSCVLSAAFSAGFLLLLGRGEGASVGRAAEAWPFSVVPAVFSARGALGLLSVLESA